MTAAQGAWGSSAEHQLLHDKVCTWMLSWASVCVCAWAPRWAQPRTCAWGGFEAHQQVLWCWPPRTSRAQVGTGSDSNAMPVRSS